MDAQDIGPIRIFPVDEAGYRTDRVLSEEHWRKQGKPIGWGILTVNKFPGPDGSPSVFYVCIPFGRSFSPCWQTFENALNTLAYIIEDPSRIVEC